MISVSNPIMSSWDPKCWTPISHTYYGFSGNKVVPVNPLVDFNSSSPFPNSWWLYPIRKNPHNQPTKAWLHLFVIANGLILYTAPRMRIRSAGVVGKGGCVGEKFSKFEPFTHKVLDFLENYERYLEFGCVQTILFYDHHRCMKSLQVITASSLR